ncbi:MAG: hypothetical protein ACYC56_15065 [Candidatus Aquicultor sp.]
MKKYFCLAGLCICLFQNPILPQSLTNDGWSAQIFYISEATINVYETPSAEAKVTGHYMYLEKVLVLINYGNSGRFVDSAGKFGWQKILYPKKGYVEEKFLITTQKKLEIDKKYGYKEEIDTDGWQYEFRFCNKNYSFVKGLPSYQSQNVGIVINGEKVLTIADEINNNKVWTKILYPFDGYILSQDILADVGDFYVDVGGLYGVSQTPYEKNFKNYKNPLGGFLEFSKTNWRLGFRVGYNHSESNISTYLLKTNLIYFQVRYNILNVFNNHLSAYAVAGGCYWFSSFQNTKYPVLASYFPLEKDRGPGYLAGGGLTYTLYNFFIDVQYFFFGSRMAVFGKEPLPGEFTNQYKLYPGSNQVNVMFGYRWIF